MLQERNSKSFTNGSVHLLRTEDNYPLEVTDTFLPFYTKDAIGRKQNMLDNYDLGDRSQRWLIGVSCMYGKTHTKEARKKISEAKTKLKGINNPRSRSYKLLGPNGEEYTIHGAFDKTCKSLGIKNAKYLREVAQGKRKECNGWICEYLK